MNELVAGVDEAGRGPLAGPVVAACVILAGDPRPQLLKDSKMLSPRQREEVYHWICDHSLAWSVALATSSEIDGSNILAASLLAMKRAFLELSPVPAVALVDGPHSIPGIPVPQKPIIRGDSLCPSISAASIVAKVVRDRLMTVYDHLFPQYGFASHKGYGTPRHLEALRLYGPSSLHRSTFAPVRDSL
ncbi:MAG: ribonuclease HII [Armatimonadetes bacterium]|nr:ribonuclease HII [Armatimonadota bacterium]